jgi:hypothetical protein
MKKNLNIIATIILLLISVILIINYIYQKNKIENKRIDILNRVQNCIEIKAEVPKDSLEVYLIELVK